MDTKSFWLFVGTVIQQIGTCVVRCNSNSQFTVYNTIIIIVVNTDLSIEASALSSRAYVCIETVSIFTLPNLKGVVFL